MKDTILRQDRHFSPAPFIALSALLLLATQPLQPLQAEHHQKASQPNKERKVTMPSAHSKGHKKNVIYILIDDLRYDGAAALGHPFVTTPRIDQIAKEGTTFKNAFVSTALCSPSRASILTGLYMHNHGVVDNNVPANEGAIFYPEYLQKAGYQTAFIGKWHMGGHNDDPKPGFDHWVSFKGQGWYYPKKPDNVQLNVNGTRTPQKGYITDELTDYAEDWLDSRDPNKPFMLYLSHKAVHADFSPAKRHETLYSDVEILAPASQANTEENYRGKPLWVKNQRNSWHGVDFPYHSDLNVKEYYRQYCRALAAVDDSVGRVLDYVKDKGLENDTAIFFMGDNGFLFGEHGLIDKRNAYEESMRVPLLGKCPGLFPAGSTVESVVANIDIAPSILELSGLQKPEHMDGESFIGLVTGETKAADWRDYFLYEYYWEYSFPQTPTIFALRGDRYKFIQQHGVWDLDELYDLKEDPREMNNLIFSDSHQKVIKTMRQELHAILVKSEAARVPFSFKRRMGNNLRRIAGSKEAVFPQELMRKKDKNE